jgi:hypothetical protein
MSNRTPRELQSTDCKGPVSAQRCGGEDDERLVPGEEQVCAGCPAIARDRHAGFIRSRSRSVAGGAARFGFVS